MLNCEIASELIKNGTAAKIIKQKKKLAKERNNIYTKFFPDTVSPNPYSFFQWLALPENQNGYNFELLANHANVKVLCSDRFAIGDTSNFSAIRIATCSPDSLSELEHGLQIIYDLIQMNKHAQFKETFII